MSDVTDRPAPTSVCDALADLRATVAWAEDVAKLGPSVELPRQTFTDLAHVLRHCANFFASAHYGSGSDAGSAAA
jgi:hypothetical protein